MEDHQMEMIARTLLLLLIPYTLMIWILQLKILMQTQKHILILAWVILTILKK